MNTFKAKRLRPIFFSLMTTILLCIAIPSAWANLELIKAIEEGNIKKIEQLMKEGVDLNGLITTHEDELLIREQTPLSIAINNSGIPRQANIELIRFLLDNGTLPNVYGLENGNPKVLPLFIAVECGRHDIVKLLLDYGADINLTSYGQTILFAATVEPNNTPMLKTLIQAGADKVINAVDSLGWTVLSNAALTGATDSFSLLLQSPHLEPETLNAIHSDGKSALHFACGFGHPGIVELILNHHYFDSGLINLPDQAGLTPLQLAVNSNNISGITALLIQSGAIVQTPMAANQQDGATVESDPMMEIPENATAISETLPLNDPVIGLIDILLPASQ